jgi:mannose-1-phosphate guanylyltransferase / mannose-6-phosphate isomerase
LFQKEQYSVQVALLGNPGNEVLRIVEAQIGGHIGEDDIGRFENNYGRV